MDSALLAAGLFAVAFTVHLVWWRIALPRRQTAVLLGLFLVVLAAWLVISSCLPTMWWTAKSFWQAVHVAIVHAACTLAYIVAYSALEHRSPSMTLLVAVADSGSKGCTTDELRNLLASVSPVELRLDAMVKDEMIARDGDTYRVVAKGRTWATVLAGWRRLLALPRGG